MLILQQDFSTIHETPYICSSKEHTTTVLWELKRRIFLPWKAAAKEFAKAGSVKLIKPQKPTGWGFNLVKSNMAGWKIPYQWRS